MGKGSSAPPPAPESQNINQSNLPAYAEPYLTDIMQRAQAESNRPYQAYEDPRVAGFTGAQTGAQQEIAGMQARPEFDQAAQFAQTGGTQALGFGQSAAGLGALAADRCNSRRGRTKLPELSYFSRSATSVYVSLYAERSGHTKTRSVT